MKKFHVRRLCRTAMVAALYVALTLISAAAGLSSGAPQVRLSEALCVLPLLFPEAVAGVTVGCLLANIITGSPLPDILIGPLATLIGAYICLLIGRHWRTGSLHRQPGSCNGSDNSRTNTCAPSASGDTNMSTRGHSARRCRLPLVLLPIVGSLPTVLANALLIPLILRYAYHLEGALWLLAAEVGAGELISCTVIGTFLILAVMRCDPRLRRQPDCNS